MSGHGSGGRGVLARRGRNRATANTSNIGSYDWLTPSSITVGSDFRIRITLLVDANATDDSDNFFTIAKESKREEVWGMSTGSFLLLVVVAIAVLPAAISIVLFRVRKKRSGRTAAKVEKPPAAPPGA